MNYKLLIIDDNEENRKLVSKALEKDNYAIIEAENGEAGIARAISERPDIILLDVMMPKLDGYEVCKRLRAFEETAFTPILFLSAHGEEEDRIRGLVAGGDDYISKPFSVRELKARVETHLSRSQAYLDANPSTRLPGGNSLNAKISECIASNLPFAIGYADLDNFKAFNDSRGFMYGDKVVRYTATIMREAISKYWKTDELAYAGHIGGDDFIYICKPERAESIAKEIVTKFGEGRNQFHTPPEIEQGFYLSKDRQGNSVEFPLLSISVAVITKRIKHIAELSYEAAEMKHLAKAMGGGIYVTDMSLPAAEANKLRVLIAEGERLRAKKIVDEFASRGLKVFVAYNGPDAIKEAHRLNPNAIVVGRTLPMLSPYETRDILSRIPATKSIPRFAFETVSSDTDAISAAVAEVCKQIEKGKMK
ncbi:MAG: hypothetical protein Kow0090_16290 [Myxococcota bacterium]